ncbi:PREDICTED: uncharacterized protein LOC108359016 [Rhagoletis zephyria]|uniref:uncharacterized protein LOC108359016 n=1 Tax=Rhagoletis zephyria TaxID=28612 RepID=UPI0008113B0A|nr:PREDICTED: uncharacterized protein LOC108359016 [Rhagoletis zephyria]
MHSSTLNCFVANRVSELQMNSVGINWRYVPTKQNPADIVSRGCMARELLNTMWFKGPAFLSRNTESWPEEATKTSFSKLELEQRKPITLKCTVGVTDKNIVENRFIGRRGIPYRIYCDNATNFVGAQAQLNELKRQFFNQQSVSDLEQFGSVHGFEFRFIPPRAPHFGGLWEAAIKSMKTLLVKYISQSNLTFEELQTVVIEVEAILNSRPLTPLTDDPNDGEALTPAHLLIGTSLKTLPEPQLNVIKESRLTSWQRITYLKQRLWDLWRRDYLHTLQVRSKWLEKQENIVPGQLVMIHDDNLPPQQWTLGRITNTSPGADGRVRVVDILTKRGTLRRPVHKIAPLPIE